MYEWYTILVASLGVLFIGIAKAGFGGGLGLLTTPICVLAFGAGGKPATFAVGTLLPLLCAGDAFSLYYYWGKWRKENLLFLLPGTVVGVLIGVRLIDRFSDRGVSIAIGAIAITFVLFQIVREKIFAMEGAFEPNHKVGVPCGITTGITSTFAHGAGPVVSMFLIPQRMPKEIFMGTSVLIFACVNWIKMPFFVVQGIITRETLLTGLYYLPLVPVGVWLGVWMNRKCSETGFLRVVYVFVFLAGLQLISGASLGKLLSGWVK